VRNLRQPSALSAADAAPAARGNMNNYLLDGVDNQEPGVITVSFSPSVEMIQEFKLDQNAYSAELGRYSGGQINVSTKSGTNRFHGSLFEFIRNDKLDAKNFFDSPTTPKPALKRNQYGASVGGPIIKGKTFFFFVWESTKLRQALTGRAAVPTEAYLRGDFSALLVPGNVYVPPGTNGTIQLVHPTTRVPFANNQIPTNIFDPVGVKIATIYPKPNLLGAQATRAINFLSNPVLINDPNQWSIRGDGPGSTNLDFSLQKYFTIREGHRLQFRAETFNALNHPNFLSPNVTANNASLFGTISAAQPGRQMQLALRNSF
jgi:hypothetical protein